ncbi:MAG: AAA family ATPase [Clostridia bacterium]|nr:AAA family ATPase [Clostridia bacterium]
MNRKDEIIALQNEIMQGLIGERMKRTGLDLWGRPHEAEKPAKREEKKEDTKAENELVRQETPPENIDDLKKELQGYIGLSAVKEEVDRLINWIEIVKLRKSHDLPAPDLSLHMVFSGNPGTGKTMIARLMARIYKSLGVLSNGHLIEVDRSGLVAGYVGQTAIKTQEVIEKAKGGVLFIDEAYALTNRGGQDYGQEAVDTLLKAMEDYRDDLVVIVAGYIELMEEFIHSNPGLESRFNRFLHFPDYTIEEMVAIFRMRCESVGYTLDEGAVKPLEEILIRESRNVKGFGNARGVRNLFEKAIAFQADRLAKGDEPITKEMLMLLTEKDIMAAGEDA